MFRRDRIATGNELTLCKCLSLSLWLRRLWGSHHTSAVYGAEHTSLSHMKRKFRHFFSVDRVWCEGDDDTVKKESEKGRKEESFGKCQLVWWSPHLFTQWDTYTRRSAVSSSFNHSSMSFVIAEKAQTTQTHTGLTTPIEFHFTSFYLSSGIYRGNSTKKKSEQLKTELYTEAVCIPTLWLIKTWPRAL